MEESFKLNKTMRKLFDKAFTKISEDLIQFQEQLKKFDLSLSTFLIDLTPLMPDGVYITHVVGTFLVLLISGIGEIEELVLSTTAPFCYIDNDYPT